jgi:hypothetical protein
MFLAYAGKMQRFSLMGSRIGPHISKAPFIKVIKVIDCLTFCASADVAYALKPKLAIKYVI